MDEVARRLTFFGLLFTFVNLAASNKKQGIDIYSFHINSTVTSRYATTIITSRVTNVLNQSQEVYFEVKIPKDAFISQFRMTIEGKTFDGVVKEKEEAQQQYSQAVSRGQSAGLVSAVGRTLEDFKTSVTVAAFSKVTFELTYEELLKRRLGKYELLINAQPMQPVADFKIDIHIHENPGISFLEVKGGLSTKDLTNAVTAIRADKDAWVKFYPTRDQQTKCDDCSKNGLNGNLIIMYDVERQKQSGDMTVSNDYFVHYFAPTDIQRIPKNVVFIIDESGSMSGKKIEQTRLAMLRILSDLAENDHFGLITFSGHVQTWKPELLKATEGNVEEAKTFVQRIRSGGSTDINSAVLKAVDMINKYPQEGSASILILLTDGDPTKGETNPEKIQENVKKAIGKKFPLYSLGFGFDVSFEFLKKLSLENNGVARRIYEDSDADRQLQGFYEEVAIPLLTDVHLNYQGVANLTQSTFNQYYNGSEIVVAGQITDNSLESFTTEVIALSVMMDRAALRLILLGVFLISATSDPVKRKQNVDIYSFYINSTVTSRYATTVITSRVANTLNESQEIQFEVKIPKNAFISKFRMTIEGKTYDGVVKEKEEAQQQYNRAVSRGQSAGQIKSVGRTLEDFKTSVTVAAFSKVTFELTYEELLKRRLGKYELLINAQPMQPVADFKMDVHIQEKPGISSLEVKGDLSTGDLANAIKTTRADKDAWVTFYPSRDQQTKCKSCGENGLNGDLLITYDVERQNPKGEVMISNGYFVHYFAPTDVPRIPKNVVFIIDQSGSMHGRKIEQTRLALLRILSDLDEDDHFGLITFDSEVSLWKRELLRATEANLKNAKSFVKEIKDRGATDINAAVLAGVDMINRHPREGTASILILLTDGDPTSGETNKEKIMGNVKKAIGTKFPLYCLGFGYDVNFDFLTKMSLENGGVARRIYEDSDADLQLQGFYEEVAVPLLSDIQLKYPGGTNLTKTSFSLYFNGSEIVVSGQITDNSVESFTTEVIAVSKGTNVTYQDTIMTKDPSDVPPENEDFMQRLWAYLTVKQLLERQVILKGQETEDEKKEALKLSLKYQFVTPLTSMVVTKPQEGDVEVADKPKEGEAPPRPPVPVPVPHGPFASPGFGMFHHSAGQPGPPAHPSLRVSGYGGTYPWLGGGRYHNSYPDAGITLADDLHDFSYSSVSISRVLGQRPTLPKIVSVPVTMPAPTVRSNRFLLPVVGQSKPLCFDVPVPHKLRLLQDSASEFSMNGESMIGQNGFHQIAFHYKTNHHLTINTTSIRYHDGQNQIEFLWGQEPTQHNTEGVSLILRSNEIDVTMGNIRFIILLHKEKRNMFLWPAVRQQPKDVSLTGILGEPDISYDEIQGTQTPTLKLKDQEVKTSWVMVKDYRLASAPVVKCWLVPFQAVTQREISDFTVTQL
ncbi:hypothetical protein G5714_011657 [Onychostoma macrolepis]|uniref:Inter-alpha-trypsin inhibitor heavy chain H3-like n=1 Tax=Onychostoma macrolepis TaxID=369639 RepID=A0A7J6CLB0_9TELE|nr:hypothetical protein G5714_011657 [Onychostoma macrolepis]